MAGKNVFICATVEDAAYYGELEAALDAWEVPHQRLEYAYEPLTALPAPTQQAIRECEVFLRVCTANTAHSSGVYLATQYFVQLLQADRQRGRRERRKLVNLIRDPAYPLSEQERKTLYIITEAKARSLWLEELAVSVGAATLTQRVSRRALFGMGVGGVLTVASAGVAGSLLVRQFQQQPPPPLPVQESISGNPRFNFSFFPQDPKQAIDPVRVFQDGATIYAQPVLDLDSFPTPIGGKPPLPENTVYMLSTIDGKKGHILIPKLPNYEENQSELVGVANGILLLWNQDPNYPELAPRQTNILRAVRASDRKQIWKVVTSFRGTPVIADGIIYIALLDMTNADGSVITYESSLNAYNLRDGSRLWQAKDYSTDSTLTPAVSGGRLYIGSYFDQDHHVYCLDAKTGKKIWSYETRGAVLGTPAIANGTVYVGSQDSTLYALDATTGKLRWSLSNDYTFFAAPLILDGVVYAPSQDGYVYALDEHTGALFWRAFVGANPTSDPVGPLTLPESVAVYRNVLFATTNGALYAFDIRRGSTRWHYIPVADSVVALSAPMMSHGLVLVGSVDGHVYAVNP